MRERVHVHVLVEFIEVLALFLELCLELSKPVHVGNKSLAT
jgi:hypothetical protein